MVSIVRKRRGISLGGIEKELEKLIDRHRLVDGSAKGLDAALNLSIGHGRGMSDTLEKLRLDPLTKEEGPALVVVDGVSALK